MGKIVKRVVIAAVIILGIRWVADKISDAEDIEDYTNNY